jgi:hypothetical protein
MRETLAIKNYFLFLILVLDMSGRKRKEKIGSVGSVGSFSLVENKNKKDRGDGGRKEGGGFPGDTSFLSKQRQKSRHLLLALIVKTFWLRSCCCWMGRG